jgi:hypothetical protein
MSANERRIARRKSKKPFGTCFRSSTHFSRPEAIHARESPGPTSHGSATVARAQYPSQW